jgi:hypothetical protein
MTGLTARQLRRRPGLPGLGEQGLDPAQPLGEVGHVRLGRALLAGLEGQHELAAGLQAAVADLGDVVGILQPDGRVQLAAAQPRAAAASRLPPFRR